MEIMSVKNNSNILYTYPNTSSISQRGGLRSRYLKLEEINERLNSSVLEIVEIPADFIKNKTEEEKTELPVCAMLNDDTVKKIYTKDHIQNEVKYILHTEPIFSRTGNNGSCTPKLKWYDANWLENFSEHLFSIINFLGKSPYAIEIHPGKYENGKNNIKSLSKAIKNLHDLYSERYGNDVLIFIENRTYQYIQDGSDIEEFWKLFSIKYPDLVHKTGIVLDIQQLYTATKKFNKDFKIEFSKIPSDSLIGAHIHERHKTPEFKYIPEEIWDYIAKENRWNNNNRPFHILLEVHPHNHVIDTYNFCKNYLRI